MGEFGLPPDWVAWIALLGAVLWLVVALSPRARAGCARFVEQHDQGVVVGLAVMAAAGSIVYVSHYLRGGPRIVDATAYWQQARTFASGHWTLPLADPSAALRGRFLYFDAVHHALGVLFPPGYAALLAIGFWLGSPFAIGAVLAALLVWSTARLTLRLFGSQSAAVLAGWFSATTVALRYHTADTMAHGFSALLVLVAIAGTTGTGVISGSVAGCSIGWLLATRPVTGMAVLLVCFAYRIAVDRQTRWLVACGVGLVPGCALWFAYQSATTGSPWHPTQLAYYAVADGPPGCFRYGFGKGIGCLFEHGTYVERRLPNGYGALQAAYVTLLRLRWHCLDVHNFEPLILAVLVAAQRAWCRSESRLLVLVIAAVLLAYAPFYFDASYPGGGARLFVDIIPLEHVLVAGWLVSSRWLMGFVPFSLAGFASHGAFEHLKLRDRDGGRPMYEPEVLVRAGVSHGLVFVDTDHGFLLGHDPADDDAKRGVVVLRQHGDAHDRIAWEHWGRPPAYRYRFDPTRREAIGTVEPIDARDLSTRIRFEAEAQWPALRVDHGWVRPVFPPNDCSSARRGLSLEPADGKASATVALYAERAGSARLTLGFIARQTGQQRIGLHLGEQHFEITKAALVHACFDAVVEGAQLQRGEQPLRIETDGLGVVVDSWQVEADEY